MRYGSKKHTIYQMRGCLKRSNDLIKKFQESGMLNNTIIIGAEVNVIVNENEEWLNRSNFDFGKIPEPHQTFNMINNLVKEDIQWLFIWFGDLLDPKTSFSRKEQLIEEINGLFDIKKKDDPAMFIKIRGKILFDHCQKNGWPLDPEQLSTAQVQEIRSLPEWKNAGK